MKIAVIVLVMLGMLAAGAAVLLVQTLSIGEPKVKMVDVLLAQADLPERTRLTKEHVQVAKVPEKGLPVGYYTNPAQAVGKILKVAVTEGQPLTGEVVTETKGLGDLLRPGMLAFSAPVSKRSTSVGLLEPGSVVDVQVTFPLRRSLEGDAVVFTLLQQIRVLGIDQDTVASEGLEKAAARQTSRSSSSVMVTLEVSDRQARALGLALKHGTIALPLRNPTDHTFYPVEVMVLKEGRLTAGSKSLDPQDLLLFNQLTALLSGQPVPSEADLAAATADPNDPNAPVQAVPVAPVPQVDDGLTRMMLEQQGPSMRTIDVIKGKTREDVEVEKKDEETPGEGDG